MLPAVVVYRASLCLSRAYPDSADIASGESDSDKSTMVDCGCSVVLIR